MHERRHQLPSNPHGILQVAVAVRMLLEENVVPNLPPCASVVTNDFRKQRLYNEDVDMLYKRHLVMLKAIYSR